ncbi:MAG TPA: hypothetical protein VGH80_05305 [Xanthomonadaceae bacterium]|jgi:hypothetical protein
MSDPTLPLPLDGMRFKGERDYLQGADILSIVLRAVCGERDMGVLADIDIVFHALARTSLTLLADAPPGSEPPVQLSCSIDGVPRRFVLVEDARPIVRREPYPEDQIVAVTTIDVPSATATSGGVLPFTNIERWIAMVKALHHAVYPQAKGKWLFVRARLASYHDACGEAVEHRVSIQSDFRGKLTRSALTVDGRSLGDIFFVLA